jgi:hypothetical protein
VVHPDRGNVVSSHGKLWRTFRCIFLRKEANLKILHDIPVISAMAFWKRQLWRPVLARGQQGGKSVEVQAQPS